MAAKKAQASEVRTFARVSNQLLSEIDNVVSGLSGLSDIQADAARGFIIRKAQGPDAVAFFRRPIEDVEKDIRRAVGAIRTTGKKPTTLLGAKKAPAQIVPNRTSGGSASSGPSKVEGFTNAQLAALRADSRTTHERLVSGNATPKEVAKLKQMYAKEK